MRAQVIHGGALQTATYYSLPGRCASMRYWEKTEECMRESPGGVCPAGKRPNGKTCHWSAKVVGWAAHGALVPTRCTFH